MKSTCQEPGGTDTALVGGGGQTQSGNSGLTRKKNKLYFLLLQFQGTVSDSHPNTDSVIVSSLCAVCSYIYRLGLDRVRVRVRAGVNKLFDSRAKEDGRKTKSTCQAFVSLFAGIICF